MTTNNPGGASTPDSVRKAQFAIVPMWAHRRIITTRTRTMALAVYVELVGQYAGSTKDAEGLRVWPQVQQIADSMGVPKSSVERALKVLIDCGVVLKKRTMRRNQYWLPQEDPDAFTSTLQDFQSVTSDGLDKVQTVTSDGPETVTSDGSQSVTSDGLYNPDPSIQTQGTQTQSLSPPPSPEPRAEPAAAASEERETDASPTKPTPVQALIRAAAVLADDENEAAFIDWVTAVHEPRSPAWWRTVAANGDLPGLVDAWRTEATPAATQRPAKPAMPPHCGDLYCDPITRQREREDKDGLRINYRCPNCHPDVAPTWASKPAKRSGGHVPFQCPPPEAYDLGWNGKPADGTRPSTADQRAGAAFALAEQLRAEDSQPLPGTDSRVAGWMALANQLDDDSGQQPA